MTNKELVIYLANIMKIIRADGVLSSSEQSLYDKICKELKAKKKDIQEAEKMAIEDKYLPAPVGCFSCKIQNLESMILVSLADGKIDINEKKAIVEFSKKTGINQEQLNLILKEAKTKLSEKNTMAICPKCKVDIPPNAKFCPECGCTCDGLSETGGEHLEFSYPREGISIEFAESTSATFDMALSVASSAPDFQKCIRNKKQWYLATWSQEQIMAAVELAENLKGMRNRKVYLNGKLSDWDAIFDFAWCMKQCDKAYKPTEYCFGVDENRLNIWGCRQIKMDWIEWAEWLSYGSFKKKDVFVFDKKRIEYQLKTNYHRIRFCPHLRHRLIPAVLELLPSQIKIDQRLWKYKESYGEGPNSIKIVVKEKEDGYTLTNEFYTDGVRPVGYSVAKEILTKALKKAGIQDVNIKSLFR